MRNNRLALQRLRSSRRDLFARGAGLLFGACLPRLAKADGGAAPEAVATLISGEPTHDSIMLQARLSHGLPELGRMSGPTPGLEGSLRFQISESRDFRRSTRTAWRQVSEAGDCIGKLVISGLKPSTAYFYRVEFRAEGGRSIRPGEVGSFITLPTPVSTLPVSFGVISCLNYEKFYGLAGGRQGGGGPWTKAAEGLVRSRGYPVMDVLRDRRVQFVVATGDTVYYDPGPEPELWARTAPQMRASWQRQFAVPSLREVLRSHGVFWMKDDHDFRYDDADNTGPRLPTPTDGRAVFLEQTPIPPDRPSYRTYRLNRHAQLWLLENRDFRSPNDAPDTVGKSLWGLDQRRWLEDTLVASDADFKIIVSPDPMIGPDDARKKDNQVDEGGFHAEGEAFLEFLRDKHLLVSTVIVTGDRHWQYHSVHPTGAEEFCCGTCHRQNSRYGVRPGDPRGTDPEARIRQPYLQQAPEGGFLQVDVDPERSERPAQLRLRLWAETGELRYERTARGPRREARADLAPSAS